MLFGTLLVIFQSIPMSIEVPRSPSIDCLANSPPSWICLRAMWGSNLGLLVAWRSANGFGSKKYTTPGDHSFWKHVSFYKQGFLGTLFLSHSQIFRWSAQANRGQCRYCPALTLWEAHGLLLGANWGESKSKKGPFAHQAGGTCHHWGILEVDANWVVLTVERAHVCLIGNPGDEMFTKRSRCVGRAESGPWSPTDVPCFNCPA